MSVSKHTPAPWIVDRTVTGEIAIFEEATGAHLLSGDGPLDLDVREANAALQSAAPDMLAALRELQEWLAAIVHHAGMNDDDRAKLAAADAAIRKAEGQA